MTETDRQTKREGEGGIEIDRLKKKDTDRRRREREGIVRKREREREGTPVFPDEIYGAISFQESIGNSRSPDLLL